MFSWDVAWDDTLFFKPRKERKYAKEDLGWGLGLCVHFLTANLTNLANFSWLANSLFSGLG